jgi:mannitol/fructose-specific phosphotransferase system IIA component (Ntr-type)
MKFTDFVCFDALVPQVAAADRDGIISELVEALAKAGTISNGISEEIAQAVIKRENEASTGMGKGVAVPHVKTELVDKPIAAIGKSGAGIDFNSLDKQPVFSMILLLSPAEKPDMHLEAMETVFKSLQDEKFRNFLRQAQTAEAIKDLLEEADEEPFF